LGSPWRLGLLGTASSPFSLCSKGSSIRRAGYMGRSCGRALESVLGPSGSSPFLELWGRSSGSSDPP
jgi:hypothetical protein